MARDDAITQALIPASEVWRGPHRSEEPWKFPHSKPAGPPPRPISSVRFVSGAIAAKSSGRRRALVEPVTVFPPHSIHARTEPGAGGRQPLIVARAGARFGPVADGALWNRKRHSAASRSQRRRPSPISRSTVWDTRFLITRLRRLLDAREDPSPSRASDKGPEFRGGDLLGRAAVNDATETVAGDVDHRKAHCEGRVIAARAFRAKKERTAWARARPKLLARRRPRSFSGDYPRTLSRHDRNSFRVITGGS